VTGAAAAPPPLCCSPTATPTRSAETSAASFCGSQLGACSLRSSLRPRCSSGKGSTAAAPPRRRRVDCRGGPPTGGGSSTPPPPPPHSPPPPPSPRPVMQSAGDRSSGRRQLVTTDASHRPTAATTARGGSPRRARGGRPAATHRRRHLAARGYPPLPTARRERGAPTGASCEPHGARCRRRRAGSGEGGGDAPKERVPRASTAGHAALTAHAAGRGVGGVETGKGPARCGAGLQMLLLSWIASYVPIPHAKDKQTTRAHHLHAKDNQTTQRRHAYTSRVVHGRSSGPHDLLRLRLGHLPAKPPRAPAETHQHGAAAAKDARNREEVHGHVRVRPPQPHHDRPSVKKRRHSQPRSVEERPTAAARPPLGLPLRSLSMSAPKRGISTAGRSRAVRRRCRDVRCVGGTLSILRCRGVTDRCRFQQHTDGKCTSPPSTGAATAAI